MTAVFMGAGYAGVACAPRLARRAGTAVRVTRVNSADRFIQRIRVHQAATQCEAAFSSIDVPQEKHHQASTSAAKMLAAAQWTVDGVRGELTVSARGDGFPVPMPPSPAVAFGSAAPVCASGQR